MADYLYAPSFNVPQNAGELPQFLFLELQRIAQAFANVAENTDVSTKANDSAVVHNTGNETVGGVKTFTSDPVIPDEAYSSAWNGVLEPPTKNAVYDKIETITGGWTFNAMGALAITTTALTFNTKSIAADSTFTFSGTPSANALFRLLVTNTDTSAHLLTFPSCFNAATGTTAAHVLVIPASGKLLLEFLGDGSSATMFGDPGYLHKYDGTFAPGANDDITHGYGAGSRWLDVANNKFYICEASPEGAAVWHALN